MRVQQFHPEKGKAGGGGEPLPQELQGNDRLRAQLTDSKAIRAALLAEPVLKPRVPLRVISPASASIQRFEGRAGPVPREQGVRGLLLCRRTNPDCRCGARCVRQVGLPAVSRAGEALMRRHALCCASLQLSNDRTCVISVGCLRCLFLLGNAQIVPTMVPIKNGNPRRLMYCPNQSGMYGHGWPLSAACTDANPTANAMVAKAKSKSRRKTLLRAQSAIPAMNGRPIAA